MTQTVGDVEDIQGNLADHGIAVSDRFLTVAQVGLLVEAARLRAGRGEFGAARIGADRQWRQREQIRGDATCWLAEPLFASERALLEDLERVRLGLNRTAFLGLFELELHYAWFRPGAGYERHVDQLQGRAQRRLSLVLYLNEHWSHAAGGELRLFDAADGYRDIAPLGGRLVCFLTAGREHAVLPTRRDRLSLTGWFRGRD